MMSHPLTSALGKYLGKTSRRNYLLKYSIYREMRIWIYATAYDWKKCFCRRCSCPAGPGAWFNSPHHFCWEKNLHAGDLPASVAPWEACGCYSSVLGVGPGTMPAQGSVSGLEGLSAFSRVPRAPKRFCLQFCRWLLVLCIIFCFPPSTGNRHINPPISVLWHYKGKQWCLYRSVLRSNAVPLHLKNTGMFCGIGLLLRDTEHVLSWHSARRGFQWFVLEQGEQHTEWPLNRTIKRN